MKQKFLSTTLLVVLSLFIFTSCSDEDDEKSIVGEWIFSSLEFDMTIDGKNYIDYYVDEWQLSEKEAADLGEQFSTSFAEAIEDVNFTFNSDGTYTAGTDSGTWSLSSDNSTITLDEQTQMEVFTLTDSKLSFGFDEEMDLDMDQDGSTESISMLIKFNFTK